MEISSPQVSIIIPTYDRSELLRDTLISVMNQTFKNWECVIVDDGGSDSTEEMVRGFGQKDKRLKFYRRPDEYPKGACGCRNFGFSKSIGKYIQWLDDDDLLSLNKLEIQVKQLEQFKDPFIFSFSSWDFLWPSKEMDLKNFFEKGCYMPKEVFEVFGEQQTFMPLHAYLIHRKLSVEAGGWNNFLEINQDAEYFTRVLLQSKMMVHSADCYVLYREHDDNRSSRKRKGMSESLLFSFCLIHSYLKERNIKSKTYFRWKLLKIFHSYWKSERTSLDKYHYFFMENGINLNFAYYYRIKYYVYRKVYPLYKKRIKKSVY